VNSGPVVLVYPYFYIRDPVPKLFPPLGLLALASQLKEEGIPTRTCDCTFLSFEQSVDRIVAAQPSVVGIYVMVTLTKNAVELVRALRLHLPETLFVAGGPLPTVYPERFVPLFDVVFRGESDLTFPRFCRAFLHEGDGLNALDLPSYPGIYCRCGDILIHTSAIHHPVSVLDRLPLPDRTDVDHDRYQQFWMDQAGCKTTSMIITRGCPFACDFCSKPVWGSVYRKPNLDRVFREMEEIFHLGYDRLWIADDSFTLDLSFLRSFCERKIELNLPLSWTCLSRVDQLDADLVALMRRAGCVGVFLGLESGSDETLRLMKKHTTVAQGAGAVRLFHQLGIAVAGFFMVGYPGEDRASVEKTLDFALSLPLQEISINVPYPLPGSPLFDRVADVESRDWETAGEITFLYRSEFDESWLRDRIHSTMEQFHKRKKGTSFGCLGAPAAAQEKQERQIYRMEYGMRKVGTDSSPPASVQRKLSSNLEDNRNRWKSHRGSRQNTFSRKGPK
jgi:anaerobic magnesium-protoporphyrin IX monomethyl ester cyclase